ncbi:MAG TPA: hypothetical protein VFQ13_22440 [Anaerolineales bacterium]|nr:hypothetical protein [Anaerolineales bacterium]
MDDTPFYKRPWFYIAGWLAVLLVIYGWSIWSISRADGLQNHLDDIFIDLACIFPVLLVLWLAFFAQFVLPVRTFRDRQKIFSRLISYLFGTHGPTLFIENGIIKEHSGERDKKGPGVLWLDSASAAVTRTAVAFKQTLGPGVHFTKNSEFIAGTLDLHNQSQVIGPQESDKPFEEIRESQTLEEWSQIQDRRRQVSALTRDGIEVIPNISVSFRVSTGFPKEGQPGSRFGYRTGVTKKDKENEKKDQDAIRRAILGEGINPNAVQDSPRHRVAWNELPGSLAVDVWREYVAKFTLDQLFQPDQPVPSSPPSVPQPTEEEIDPLSRPIQVGSNRQAMQTSLARMVREVNLLMAKTIAYLEGKKEEKSKRTFTSQPFTTTAQPSVKKEPEKKTALQVINEMVKARLTHEEVDVLDDHGVRLKEKAPSLECKLLEERGIEVLNVSIGNLRFNPQIEDTILSRWSTTWLMNAKVESEQVERKRNLMETAGQEQAIRQYADFLSKDLIQKKPVGIKETLKTLLLRTRTLIMNSPQLRQRMTEEQQDLEEIIRWMESV